MIKVEHLTKQYGNKYAVNDISFEVGDGEIVGFLGPNGAGKTTTMNIITGYLAPSAGTVIVDGYDIIENATEAKKRFGYVPEQPPLYPEMTVDEYLSFVFELKKCTFNKKKHLDEICEVIKIADVRKRVIGNLSKGYKQRVGIAQALVGNPKVIILDEPTSGLDPKQIVEIRNLIRTLGLDHTIILSTHILSEVQATCDRVIVMNKGKIAADELTENISQAYAGTRRFSAKICGNPKEIASAISSIVGVSRVETIAGHDLDSTTFIIESSDGVDIRKPLFNLLADRRYPLIGLESAGVSLEDVFLSLTGVAESKDRQKKKRIRINNG